MLLIEMEKKINELWERGNLHGFITREKWANSGDNLTEMDLLFVNSLENTYLTATMVGENGDFYENIAVGIGKMDIAELEKKYSTCNNPITWELEWIAEIDELSVEKFL